MGYVSYYTVILNLVSNMFLQCQCPNISAASIHQALRQINKELHIQSLSQKDRKYYYSMISYLLTNRLKGRYNKLCWFTNFSPSLVFRIK